MLSHISIWKDSHVQSSPNGWQCLWCQKSYAGHAANRDISHLYGIKLYEKTGIEFCTGNISDEKFKYYQSLATAHNNKREHSHYFKAQCANDTN